MQCTAWDCGCYERNLERNLVLVQNSDLEGTCEQIGLTDFGTRKVARLFVPGTSWSSGSVHAV